MTEIGTVLGGRYRLVELLGQGGMATIYRSHDNQLDRDVAVKLLRPEYGRDPEFLSRFRQEAQAAASLNHPNIVSVFDYGQDAAGPFIVMELVEGEDLASIVRRSGALPPRQAARITTDAARALEAAHTRGIVHRDVKPGNIMISRDGRVKVADFGIARAMAEAQMTLPGTTLGSVHYFSPEQARGETADAASDIFSLGIVLFEELTGQRPWEGDTAASVAMARLAGPTPDPAARRAGISSELAAITRKAMAAEPEDRWESADAFADALEAFLAGTAIPGLVPIAGATAAGTGAGAAGAAAAGVAAGAVTVGAMSATARANPNAIPYAPDAYADGTPTKPPPPPGELEEDESGTSPMTWIAGIIAIVILALAGFLVFRLLSGDERPPAGPVEVPNFVGLSFTDAQDLAEERGLEVVQDQTTVDPAQVGKVLAQDPQPGTEIDPDTAVKLTVAVDVETVPVPDLRNKSEQEALQLLITAGLAPGTKTEAFDPAVPVGLIVTQAPGPGVIVNQGTAVSYAISKGPEPSPTPTPTPTPTPPPTPAPTPVPTPAPTPTPVVVGDYCGLTLGEAADAIAADELTYGGTTTPGATDEWFVNGQQPLPGTERPPGSEVTVNAVEAAPTCP